MISTNHSYLILTLLILGLLATATAGLDNCLKPATQGGCGLCRDGWKIVDGNCVERNGGLIVVVDAGRTGIKPGMPVLLGATSMVKIGQKFILI